MKRLTQKQESFCLAYIETGNASEAYRQVYDTGKMKPETINRNAKALMDDSKITARLDELRAPAREAAQLTLEKHLATLADLRDKATENGMYGAAVTAEVARGRAAGLYIERREFTGRDGGPIEVEGSRKNIMEDMTDEELEVVVAAGRRLGQLP